MKKIVQKFDNDLMTGQTTTSKQKRIEGTEVKHAGTQDMISRSSSFVRRSTSAF